MEKFMMFCVECYYKPDTNNSNEKLASILRHWAFNMRKIDGSYYKQSVIQTIETLLQNQCKKNILVSEKYCDPSKDIIFKEARTVRDNKRKLLQVVFEKRKISSVAMTSDEY